MSKSSSNPLYSVYISYSHKDADWKDRILRYLSPLEAQGTVTFWKDTKLRAGAEWGREISEQRSRVSAAILLISSAFLSSDYIVEQEVPALLRQREETGCVCFQFSVCLAHGGR